MGSYICTNCNFRFNSRGPIDCPYCGKKNIEREKDASELLEEVKRLLES